LKAEASSSGTQTIVHNEPGLSPHQSWTSAPQACSEPEHKQELNCVSKMDSSKNNFALIMQVLTHNTHYVMLIVPVRPISLCSIGVNPDARP